MHFTNPQSIGRHSGGKSGPISRRRTLSTFDGNVQPESLSVGACLEGNDESFGIVLDG